MPCAYHAQARTEGDKLHLLVSYVRRLGTRSDFSRSVKVLVSPISVNPLLPLRSGFKESAPEEVETFLDRATPEPLILEGSEAGGPVGVAGQATPKDEAVLISRG